jgi:hypothetical protein
MSSVGCSLGLTLGGMRGGRHSVGGGSAGEGSASTSEVPSCVQNVSHSSVNSWLQVGQRFMIFYEGQTSSI